jgi:dephospho-CoA kinase
MSFVVGLTGGIGSGKSAAAAEFERLGASVVDTDAIAHELTAAGGPAISKIRKRFGAEVLDASGALDRKRMRDRVFADPAARKALEGLLHPLIREESRRRIERAPGPYVVHVVPLLVESPDYRRRVDRVLVVDAPEELQLERVRRRSGLADDAVRAIVAAQATRAQRLAAADDVIENRGTIDALREQVAALHRRYLEYSKAAQ